jgi:hypothetical protein
VVVRRQNHHPARDDGAVAPGLGPLVNPSVLVPSLLVVTSADPVDDRRTRQNQKKKEEAKRLEDYSCPI